MNAYIGRPISVAFVGGDVGQWRIDSIRSVVGDSLPDAKRLAVFEQNLENVSTGSAWILRGSTSNARYTFQEEAEALSEAQEGLGRPQATCAALIPVRKSSAWWSLAQDQRRSIFEDQSHHIRIGLEYLPGVSRRLHHGRELGEPFDFLTWFEYSPEDSEAFENLVARLRQTTEWGFVDREVDVRLSRTSRPQLS